jgi:hypothetical protein
MAFADRTHIARTGRKNVSRSRELMAGAAILLAALIATLGFRRLVPADAVAPMMVTLLFAGSAVAAGFALLCRRDQPRILWFDLAGGLTFIGIVISVFIEPDQLARLVSVSDQPE